MTEDDWLTGEASYQELLAEPDVTISSRKLQLFLCGCVRWVEGLLVDDRCRAAIEAAERFVDDQIPESALRRARRGAWEVGFLGVGGPADRAAYVAAEYPTSPILIALVTQHVRAALEQEASWRIAQGQAIHEGFHEVGKAARLVQEALFRDIVGNPFRPVVLDPTWLTWNDGVAASLAHLIYHERRFDDLPILGDALEEAGCDIDPLLDHCHRGGPHVRGCWVVDLCVGRT